MAIAVKRLIDSVWAIRYEILPSNKVKIISYSREDAEGYDREDELPKGFIEEAKDPGRIADKLVLQNGDKRIVFKIDNPANIFSYPFNKDKNYYWFIQKRGKLAEKIVNGQEFSQKEKVQFNELGRIIKKIEAEKGII